MKGNFMTTSSKTDEKSLRKIIISFSECDNKMAEDIKDYFKNNNIEKFEVKFEIHPLNQDDKILSKSISDVINGKIDCLLILFSEDSMNAKWLQKDAQALRKLGMRKKSIGVIPVNCYVEYSLVPKLISSVQRFKFDNKIGSIDALIQLLLGIVMIEIKQKEGIEKKKKCNTNNII